MFQYKLTRKEYKLTVEFLNGYLTSIAKIKDTLSLHLSHQYFFERIPKRNEGFKHVVTDKLENEIRAFCKLNISEEYDEELYSSRFQNNMQFEKQENWKQIIRIKAKNWLSLKSVDLIINPQIKNCLIDNFIDIIEDFFAKEKFEMYLMKGDILNDLSLCWGGIGFQDFFFETDQNVYILHFALMD